MKRFAVALIYDNEMPKYDRIVVKEGRTLYYLGDLMVMAHPQQIVPTSRLNLHLAMVEAETEIAAISKVIDSFFGHIIKGAAKEIDSVLRDALDAAIQAGKLLQQKGRQEVVDWINEHEAYLRDKHGPINCPRDTEIKDAWEAQLKAWGIKPKEW